MNSEKRLFRNSSVESSSRVLQIAFAHDSTRVIQCLIQYGSEEQRKWAFEELQGIGNKQCVYLIIKSLVFPRNAEEYPRM